jgi:hypothetical protein
VAEAAIADPDAFEGPVRAGQRVLDAAGQPLLKTKITSDGNVDGLGVHRSPDRSGHGSAEEVTEVIASLVGLGIHYKDGVESLEVRVPLKDADPLPYELDQRVQIDLVVDGHQYDAGLRATAGTKLAWISPDLLDENGQKVRLADVLQDVPKNSQLRLRVVGHKVTVLRKPAQVDVSVDTYQSATQTADQIASKEVAETNSESGYLILYKAELGADQIFFTASKMRPDDYLQELFAVGGSRGYRLICAERVPDLENAEKAMIRYRLERAEADKVQQTNLPEATQVALLMQVVRSFSRPT